MLFLLLFLAANPSIQKVEVRGVDGASIPTLKTRAGRSLNKEIIQEDIRTLWATRRFENIEVFLHRTKHGTTVLFEVEPYPRLRNLSFSGIEALQEETLREVVRLTPGIPLTETMLTAAKRKLQQAYIEEGYRKVAVALQKKEVAGEIDLQIAIKEGPQVTIHSVELMGNERVSDTVLKNLMQTKPRRLISVLTSSGLLREAELELDLLRINAAYYDRGFINVRVEPPTITEIDGALKIEIRIHEGDPFRLGKIAITGELPQSKETLRARLHSKSAAIFNRSALQKDILILQEAWHMRGWQNATATPLTEIEGRTINVTFQVERQP